MSLLTGRRMAWSISALGPLCFCTDVEVECSKLCVGGALYNKHVHALALTMQVRLLKPHLHPP
jgi:hypothetical protein